jgi:mono/diheme cytochrome c family protein
MRRPALLTLILLLASAPGAALPVSAERGRYLAAAGNCGACHTRRGGAPFAGGLAFETPFGTIYSSNITPDLKTGIGRWSAADLRRAMHEGISADGSRLFPAFPYASYTKVTDADVNDIHAYLKTLKPVRYVPPDNSILFSMRFALAAWNMLYLKPGRFLPDPQKSAEWNRGAYLVEGLGHCGACHTPRNAQMAELPEKALQGGTITGEVAPGKPRDWYAVNLTNARHGLAAWTEADLVRYFQTGVSPRGSTLGPMNEVVVHSLKHLTEEDLRSMAVYLKSVEGPPYAGSTVAENEARPGEPIYTGRCEECHGPSGRGGFFTGPPVAASAIVQGENPATLINVILYGSTVAREAAHSAWEKMPAYSETLDDSEVAAISNFLRGSWGNRAAPVTAEDVRRQR